MPTMTNSGLRGAANKRNRRSVDKAKRKGAPWGALRFSEGHLVCGGRCGGSGGGGPEDDALLVVGFELRVEASELRVISGEDDDVVEGEGSFRGEAGGL